MEGVRAPDSDAEAVARVLRGETDAFGLLVTRYRAAFGRYATAICGDPDLAADALQDAFIRAFEGLARCRKPERFGAWFFRILTNQCRNHRSRWRRRELVEWPAGAAGGAPTDQALLTHELRDRIQEGLDRLSDEQREAFVMRHVDGRSYREMAGLLGQREDALRMRVHRARDELQRFLEERG